MEMVDFIILIRFFIYYFRYLDLFIKNFDIFIFIYFLFLAGGGLKGMDWVILFLYKSMSRNRRFFISEPCRFDPIWTYFSVPVLGHTYRYYCRRLVIRRNSRGISMNYRGCYL